MKYKRIMLKISGEALSGEKGYGIDEKTVDSICKTIKKCQQSGVEIVIVVGGGNFARGRSLRQLVDDYNADYMGLLSTIMNALALGSRLQKEGVSAKVFSAIEIAGVAEDYSIVKANQHLGNGTVVVLGGGIGQPCVSSDTAVALMSLQLDVSAILWGKNNVDGIYNEDPKLNKNAKLIEKITYEEILTSKLNVIDLSATALLVQHNFIPSYIFNISNAENINKILNGEQIGTIVKGVLHYDN